MLIQTRPHVYFYRYKEWSDLVPTHLISSYSYQIEPTK